MARTGMSSQSTPALPSQLPTISRPSLWSESDYVLKSHRAALPFLEPPELSRTQRFNAEEPSRRSMRMTHEQVAAKRGSIGGEEIAEFLQPKLSPMRNSLARLSVPRDLAPPRRKAPKKGSMMFQQKASAAAALAFDRQFVQKRLMEQAETTLEREAREQTFDDHWWSALFTPVPRPRELLPASYQASPPVLARAISPFQMPAFGASEQWPELSFAQVEEILAVCTGFNDLVTPPGQIEGHSVPVLGRPSFCRLVCAFEGFSVADRASHRFHQVVRWFDQLATFSPVRNCSCPNGQVNGLALGTNALDKKPAELPICMIFSRVMHDMCNDPYFGKKSNEERLFEVNARIFKELMPRATEHMRRRSELLRHQIAAGGLAVRRRGSVRRASTLSIALTEVPPSGSSPGSPTSQGDRPAEFDAEKASEAAGPEEGGMGGDEEASALANAEEAAALDEEELDGEDTPDNIAARAAMFAHTFLVLKGELLTSQLLEPEVVHFMFEFDDLFAQLFRSYSDIPTGNKVGETDGHMSLNAFIRFCNDFGLFPSLVDFQTIQWFYDTAQGCLELPAPVIEASPEPEDPEPKSEPKPKPKKEKTERKRNNSDDKGKKAQIVEEKSPPEPVEELSVLWCGFLIAKSVLWLTNEFTDMTAAESAFAAVLWSMGDWLNDAHLKASDFFALLLRGPLLVIGVEEFLTGIRFMKFEDGPGEDDIRKMWAAVVPQKLNEEGLVESQDLELAVLEDALAILRKHKKKLNRATNCFVKPYCDMSTSEYGASVFFKELHSYLEHKSLTPDDLFDKAEANVTSAVLSPGRGGHAPPPPGELVADDLLREAKELIHWAPTHNVSLESPFEMMDHRGLGFISREEFREVMEKAREAAELRKQDEEGTSTEGSQHPLFLSACSSLQSKQTVIRRVFGRRAFAESLIKMALGRLNFHSTAMQADQPAMTKVVWLYLFLHWQFCRKREAHQALLQSRAEHCAEHSIPPSPCSAAACQANACIPGLGRTMKYSTPMNCLLRDVPELFKTAPSRAPPDGVTARPAGERCGTCGVTSWNGWGSPVCPKCSQADGLMRYSFAEGPPAASGLRCVDRCLLLAGCEGAKVHEPLAESSV
eukprot:gnl/TRDRNA2_/TRDRNA2_82935_c0_seq2.p1 gnl/TRDRNA2_/TRDRNA2_82935_c0~~gnl/TRDRNA2_/TRDRNA2_82935_c0_seq2.p1  ORF type:complete len:1146 (-),score=237.64 gnl/TRDRNA2_/TRDRNA2_82935_c0_seq2:42-3365(-)